MSQGSGKTDGERLRWCFWGFPRRPGAEDMIHFISKGFGKDETSIGKVGSQLEQKGKKKKKKKSEYLIVCDVVEASRSREGFWRPLVGKLETTEP